MIQLNTLYIIYSYKKTLISLFICSPKQYKVFLSVFARHDWFYQSVCQSEVAMPYTN